MTSPGLSPSWWGSHNRVLQGWSGSIESDQNQEGLITWKFLPLVTQVSHRPHLLKLPKPPYAAISEETKYSNL